MLCEGYNPSNGTYHIVTFQTSDLKATARLLVPGHFYFYAVSKFSLRENDISVLLL